MSINILGVKVDKTSPNEVISKIESFLNDKKKFYIVTPNPEIILAATKNKNLKDALNGADISVPDGVGLKLASPTLPIIKGRTLMEDILTAANLAKLRVYFLGGTERENKLSIENVAKRLPYIALRGSAGPMLANDGIPKTDNDNLIEKQIVEKINLFRPHLVFVAFGAPKQELWTRYWLPKLTCGGMMVVGGGLSYLSGTAKVPPKFVSDFGLEWLWRLTREPWRIVRIFNATVVFPVVLSMNSIKRSSQITSQKLSSN